MTDFEFGDVVLVSFPFTNQSGHKQRPAVVINTKSYSQAKADVILMAVTSQVKIKPVFAETQIENWQAAGLLKESVIKPVIFTVDKGLIRKVLGCLSEADKQKLKQTLVSVIELE